MIGTTGLCQPLDCFQFNQTKRFARRIVCELQRRRFDRLAEHITYPAPYERDFICRMQSFILQQFNSPKYAPMIRGSWRIGGYTKGEEIERFGHIVQDQFRNFTVPECEQPECTHPPYMWCYICNLQICFECALFSENLIHHHFQEDLKPIVVDYKALNFVKQTTRKRKHDEESDEE